MLKGISPLISPELLKILAEMGHGDEIVFGDGNFPAASNAQHLVRCDGHDVCALLEAVLPLFPVEGSAVMATAEGTTPPVWAEFAQALRKSGAEADLEEVERFAFYERARRAYAIIATGETALYGNLILRKGVIG